MTPGWQLHRPTEAAPWADLTPVNDSHPLPHFTGSFEDSCACWCKPEVRMEAGYPLVIHSAFDGRELVEKAEALTMAP